MGLPLKPSYTRFYACYSAEAQGTGAPKKSPRLFAEPVGAAVAGPEQKPQADGSERQPGEHDFGRSVGERNPDRLCGTDPDRVIARQSQIVQPPYGQGNAANDEQHERRGNDKDAEPPPQAFAGEKGNARHGESGSDNAQENAAAEERQPREPALEGKITVHDVCHSAPLHPFAHATSSLRARRESIRAATSVSIASPRRL